MFQQEHLKYCLSEVEKKLNWKQSKFWKESDYIKLSKIISDTSNISISPHTLKRLFGKIKYKKYYNPQVATKDALSKYLGFSDWDSFVAQNKSLLEANKKSLAISKINNKKNFQKAITYILAAVVSILLIFFLTRSLNDSKSKTLNFSFTLNDSVGTVPYTVPVKYDFFNTDLDSIYIDFDFKHPFRGKQIIKPRNNGTIANFSYQIPGYYHITLRKSKDTIDNKNVLVMSEEWDSYFTKESKLGEFWLDNEIEQFRDSTGYLYFSPKYLFDKGFDTSKVFYTTHRLYKKFEIDGDNFEFETRFKNSKALGGMTCYDFIIRLVCEKNFNYLNLMESGCSQYSAIKFGEVNLKGSQENLSDFKINPEQWNTLKVSVKNKHVKVFVNKVLIYSETYKKSNGKIVGIENIIKGTGVLDYISIKDLKTENIFYDDFK